MAPCALTLATQLSLLETPRSRNVKSSRSHYLLCSGSASFLQVEKSPLVCSETEEDDDGLDDDDDEK